MKDHVRSLSVTLALTCGLACFAPGNLLRAQSTAPSGSYGFLITPSFDSTSDATGLAILGVMNFDGAGNVTGPYTYEVDANNAQAAKTTTGTFTGTFSSNPDGTGSVTIALDAGITLTLATVTSEGGQRLQFVATSYQFPAAKCGCSIGRIVLSGIARAGTVGSLSGSYGFQLNIAPNSNVILGVATFDGAGNVALSLIFVGASDSSGQPTPTFSATQTGTYSINPNGTGTIDLAAAPGSNRQTYSYVVTDGGSGILLIQTDRAGNGVSAGTARLQ